MPESAPAYERLVLADDLHLTWDRHLLTVASSRWDPGAFLYDIEYLSIEVKPARGAMRIVLGARGAHIPFQVLRFELDAEAFARFDAFVGRMREHRDRLRSGA